MMCDKHVVKMIVETAQLLSTAWHASIGPRPIGRLYKITHPYHPCSLWVRESKANYQWTYAHGTALLAEYTLRYSRVHASTDVYETLHSIPRLSDAPFSEPPFCGAEDCRTFDVVESYRRYYCRHKAHFARWTNRVAPSWWSSSF